MLLVSVILCEIGCMCNLSVTIGMIATFLSNELPTIISGYIGWSYGMMDQIDDDRAPPGSARFISTRLSIIDVGGNSRHDKMIHSSRFGDSGKMNAFEYCTLQEVLQAKRLGR